MGPSESLRELQANVTRERILSSVGELLERGGTDGITMQEVAEASGASLRTVYRYFPTRERLLEAAGRWIGEELLKHPYPETLDDLADLCRTGCRDFDQHPGLIRAMALSPIGQEMRGYRRHERLEALGRVLREEVGGLGEPEIKRVEAVLAYLYSMLAYTYMREEGGLSGDEIGSALAWAIGTLVADLKSRSAPAAAPARRAKPRPSRAGPRAVKT